MSKEGLEIVNKKLIEHLKGKNIENAFYYAPIKPDSYWNQNIKIGMCNLETYNKGKDDKEFLGINLVTQDILDNWSWGNKTISNTLFINFCIRRCIENGFSYETKNSLKNLKKLAKNEKDPEYWNVYEAMDESLYLNFRHSISKTRRANNSYLISSYAQDKFICENYREYIKEAEIDVLVVGGETSVQLLGIIYPELKNKLTFCGEPVFFDGTLFVSMRHPAYMRYEELADCVNKIASALKK